MHGPAIPTEEGRRNGISGVDDCYRSQMIDLAEYLTESKDQLLQIVTKLEEELPVNRSILKLAELFYKEIEEEEAQQKPTQMENTGKEKEEDRRSKKEKFIDHERKRKHQRWNDNHRAGRYYQELQKNYIDKEGSVAWIKNGELPYDQEKMIIAAQDQGHMTNGFKKLVGLAESDKCRFCHQVSESCTHLLSGCQVLLADGHYTKRHNRVCKYIHWKICTALKIPVKEPWLHEPAPVTTNEKVVVFYDKIITAGRYIESSAIRPDLVIWDKETQTAQIKMSVYQATMASTGQRGRRSPNIRT